MEIELDILEKEFRYTIIKKRFMYIVYKHLKKHKWPYKIVIYESNDSYHSIVTLMFRDEFNYFRCLEIPLPILERDAELSKKVNDELLSVASELLEDLKEAKRVPREIWGKITTKDLYEMLSGSTTPR